MTARALACLLCAAAAATADPPLETIVAKVQRRAAAKLNALARSAELAELHRTARLLRLHVLRLDPGDRVARRLLGYERAGKTWTRDAAVAKELVARQDADPELAKRFLADAKLLEKERLDEVVRVCTKYGTLAEKQAVLHPLLERMPKRADIHRALGHPRVGDRHVRPGLVDLAKRMPWYVPAWRKHAAEAVDPEPTRPPLTLPGLDPQPPFFAAEGRRVASSLEQAARCARDVARTQRLLRWMLGPKLAVWDPDPVVFLQPKPYGLLVRALHADEEAFKLYARYGNYEHVDFYAIRVWNVVDAGERYAHAAGYMTMYELAAPAARDDPEKRDTRAYAWLLEGFGYLLGFELFDRGQVSYVSIEETARKRTFTRPPPATRTRANCLAWVREQMRARRGYALREICAKSLNNLDFCASMQAYTFVRFLLLFDPEAFRRLPAALRALPDGPLADRADRALAASYGRSLAALAALWRAFLLELEE